MSSGTWTVACGIFRYLEVLLRRVSMGQVMYSPNYKAFISLVTNKADVQMPVQAEEYADLMGENAVIALFGIP